MEPSFPFTNCDIDNLKNIIHQVPDDWHPLGVMGNAQSHCVQLPNTYLFAHFAKGGTKQQVDLASFGNNLLTGCGDTLATAWMALAGDSVLALVNAKKNLNTITGSMEKQGHLSGLCFSDTERLIQNLLLQVELKTALLELRDQLDRGASAGSLMKTMVDRLDSWSERHGFEGRYCGPLKELMHPVLLEASKRISGAGEIKTALDDFDNGPIHGAFTRLLSVLKDVVKTT